MFICFEKQPGSSTRRTGRPWGPDSLTREKRKPVPTKLGDEHSRQRCSQQSERKQSRAHQLVSGQGRGPPNGETTFSRKEE